MSVTRLRWMTDLGVTVGSVHPTAHQASLIARREGYRWGYPACCVNEFAEDVLAGRLPAVRRGSVTSPNGGRYVPCSRCCEQIGREIAA